MRPFIRTSFAAAAAMLVIFAGAGQAVASSDASAARLVAQVARGETRCEDLNPADFVAIGDYVMGRMLGSPDAHASMDQLMSRMMGAADADRVHQAMGERVAGCGNPTMPAGFGSMMGAMGMIGGFGPGPAHGTAYHPGAYGGPGSMMAFSRRNGGDDNDVPSGWMVAMMLILVGGLAAIVYAVVRLIRHRPGAHGSEADRILAQRFARGEIDAEDYRRMRELLGGGT